MSHSSASAKHCVLQLLLFDRNSHSIVGVGSGAFVSSQGHILTAAHTLLDTDKKLADGRTANPNYLKLFGGLANCVVLVASYVGDDQPPKIAWKADICSAAGALKATDAINGFKDIAVLRIAAVAICSHPPRNMGKQPSSFMVNVGTATVFKDIHFLPMSTSSVPGIGEAVRAFGYPADGASPRSLPVRLVCADAAVAALSKGFIHIDSTNTIASGGSGGPLVNSAGKIAGLMSNDCNGFNPVRVRTSSGGVAYTTAEHMTGGGTNLSSFRQLAGQIQADHNMPLVPGNTAYEVRDETKVVQLEAKQQALHVAQAAQAKAAAKTDIEQAQQKKRLLQLEQAHKVQERENERIASTTVAPPASFHGSKALLTYLQVFRETGKSQFGGRQASAKQRLLKQWPVLQSKRAVTEMGCCSVQCTISQQMMCSRGSCCVALPVRFVPKHHRQPGRRSGSY